MKLLFLIPLALIQVFAQNIQGIDEQQMQKMMAGLQDLQVCMSKLDMSALQKMQTEAINTEKDVKEMCANGQRDKAQKVA
ncbi:hypothetical protein JHD50_00895, partial [Sulfurimonas sp. MAG313]